MSEPIVIVGCGGHGREIYSIIGDINDAFSGSWEVVGFVDDNPSEQNIERIKRLGARYLGTAEAMFNAAADNRYVLGIGDPRIRAKVADRIASSGLRPGQLVHPSASVGRDTEIQEGTVLFPGARVTTNVRLGRHVHINQNATVGHDSTLDDFATVNPLAAISGDCHIGKEALVGTTAAVLQGRTIGAQAIVGAGACVVHNVDPGRTVKGVPAR